jgi:hypothetical protein
MTIMSAKRNRNSRPRKKQKQPNKPKRGRLEQRKKFQTEHRLSIGLEKKRRVISCLSAKQIISTGAYQIVPVSRLSETKRNIVRKNTVEEKE